MHIEGGGGFKDRSKLNTTNTFLITELSAVICVAGGWLGGNVKDESIFDGLDKMFTFNLQSSVAAAHIAANFLTEGGLLVLTGNLVGNPTNTLERSN